MFVSKHVSSRICFKACPRRQWGDAIWETAEVRLCKSVANEQVIINRIFSGRQKSWGNRNKLILGAV